MFSALKQNNKEVDFGFSPSAIEDLNKFLKFKVKKNSIFQLDYTDSKGEKKQTEIAVQGKEELFKLYKS